jgi:hypothetical protein
MDPKREENYKEMLLESVLGQMASSAAAVESSTDPVRVGAAAPTRKQDGKDLMRYMCQKLLNEQPDYDFDALIPNAAQEVPSFRPSSLPLSLPSFLPSFLTSFHPSFQRMGVKYLSK